MADIDKMKIKIEVDSSEVGKASGEVDKLKKSATDAQAPINGLGDSLGSIAKYAAVSGVVYELVNATKAFVATGINFNAQIETMKIGIASLIAVSKENTLVTGQQITAVEKFRLAQIQSAEVMQMLKRANLETSATLEQLGAGFQAALAPATQAGLSIAQTVEYTKLMTQAAGAMGVSMQQLPQELKSVVAGTIDLNSVVASNLGITNEQIKKHKEQGDLFIFLKDKLKDFAIAGQEVSNSFDGAMSNLSDSFSNLAGVVSKPIFDALKIEANDLASTFVNLSDTVQKLYDKFKSPFELNTINQLTDRAMDVSNKIIAKQKDIENAWEWTGTKGKLQSELRALKQELNAVNQQFENVITTQKKSEQLVSKPAVKTETKTKHDPWVQKQTELEIMAMSETSNAYQKHYEELETKRQADLKKFGNVKAHEILINKAYNAQISKLQTEANDAGLKIWTDYEDKKISLAQQTQESLAFINQSMHELNLKDAKDKQDNLKQDYDLAQASIMLISDTATREQALMVIKSQARQAELQGYAEANPLATEYYTALSDLEAKLLEMSQQQFSIKLTIEGLDNQLEILETTKNGYNDFYVDLEKAQLEYAKSYLESNGDIEKQKIAEAKFNKKSSDIKQQQSEAEINAYSNLAGAIGGALEEGSAAQKAFMLVSQSLGMVNAIGAVINAWNSAPFPANLPVVATTSAAVVTLLAQMASVIGGSGGGAVSGGASSGSSLASRTSKIEAQYKPYIDRLDKQIELLEAIEKNGSAQRFGVQLSTLEFERDFRAFIGGDAKKYLRSSISGGNEYYSAFQKATEGLDFVTTKFDALGNATKSIVNLKAFRDSDVGISNFLKYISAISDFDFMMAKKANPANLEKVQLQYDEFMTSVQEIISNYAISMSDVVNEMKDASDKFQDIYDSITETTTYADEKLKKALASVKKIAGSDLPTYLTKQIRAIDAVTEKFGEDVYSLLTTVDPSKVQAQVEALQLLEEQLGVTFANGVEEALNYLDAIELVGEAMAKSAANVSDWFGSLLTDQQSAELLAFKEGTALATTVEGLSALFNQLAYDSDGLTDQELELLNANKSLLESTDSMQTEIESLNTTIDGVSKNISSLDDVLSNIKAVIEKLRGASETSTQSLAKFYESMSKAKSLSTTTDYENYSLAVQEAIKYSDSLMVANNFKSSMDMKFAQAVAASQFEDLQDTTMTQIDYLKLIEENTRNQITALQSAMESIGSKINLQLAQQTQTYAVTNASNVLATSSKEQIAALNAKVTTAESNIKQSELDLAAAQKTLEETATFGAYSQEFVDSIKALSSVAKGGITAKEAGASAVQLGVLAASMGLGTTISEKEFTSTILPYLESQLAAQKNVNEASTDLLSATKTLENIQTQYTQAISTIGSTVSSAISAAGTAPLGGVGTVLSQASSALSNIKIDTTPVQVAPITETITKTNSQELADKLAAATGYGSNFSTSEMKKAGFTTNEIAALQSANSAIGQKTSIDSKDIANLVATLYAKPFAEGGIVTKPTLGLIGEAGYKEAIIPLKDKDPIGIAKLGEKLDSLKNLMIKLVSDNSKMLTIDRAMYANAIA